MLPVVLLVTVLCVVLGISLYRKMSDGMVAMGVEQADLVSRMAVKVVDGDALKSLEPGCEESTEYQAIWDAMSEIQQSYGIKYLYTLYTDGKTVYYGVDTDTSEGKADFGEEFEVSYEELQGCFAGEAYVQDYIDETEDGELISVYKPIYDGSGAVVADEISKLASDSAEAATSIQKVSFEVIQAVNDLAREAGEMLTFMEETAMKGYEKLLDISESYQGDVGSLNGLMQNFAAESALLKQNMDGIVASVEAVRTAVGECTSGVADVSERSVELTMNVAEIEGEADINKEIALNLNQEVNKFKLV